MKAKYTILKICMNCFNQNYKDAQSCRFCGHLLVGEVSNDEYYKLKNELELKKLEKLGG